MRRLLIPLLLILLAVGLIQTQQNVSARFDEAVKRSLVSLVEQTEDSVVFIEALDGDYVMWTGSGVIIDPNGIVVTAAHVVEDANQFRVTLSDGRVFLSTVSFGDRELTDVGFIEIVSENLPFSYLGNSDHLRKGERVFMIGFPYGNELSLTVTSGIISGLDRVIDGPFGRLPLIQGDIHAYPGSSGAPVFNLRGQIIGIHSGRMTGGCGITVSVPSNTVEEIFNTYEVEDAVN